MFLGGWSDYAPEEGIIWKSKEKMKMKYSMTLTGEKSLMTSKFFFSIFGIFHFEVAQIRGVLHF